MVLSKTFKQLTFFSCMSAPNLKCTKIKIFLSFTLRHSSWYTAILFCSLQDAVIQYYIMFSCMSAPNLKCTKIKIFLSFTLRHSSWYTAILFCSPQDAVIQHYITFSSGSSKANPFENLAHTANLNNCFTPK
jgi:hypothetical protein